MTASIVPLTFDNILKYVAHPALDGVIEAHLKTVL